MRVLVTGAGGFVGSHVLVSVLEKTDWDIVTVDSLHSRHNGNVANIIGPLDRFYEAGRLATAITHDLTVPFRDKQIDRMGEIDFIINIASMSQVGASIKDPVGFIGNNVQLMLNMLELARDLRPKRFIHMSTDEVYGTGRGCSPADHQPSSPYAASKASQEDISLSYRRTFKVPVTIVNSSNMFGEGQSELAFIPNVVRWIAQGDRIPIHYHGDVPGGRNYTYVRNVADHIVGLLREDVDHVSSLYQFPQRVPLRGQEYVDNHALVERIAAIMGKEPYIIKQRGEDARPGYDAVYAPLDLDKGWRPVRSFDEGLKSTVQWLEKNL